MTSIPHESQPPAWDGVERRDPRYAALRPWFDAHEKEPRIVMHRAWVQEDKQIPRDEKRIRITRERHDDYIMEMCDRYILRRRTRLQRQWTLITTAAYGTSCAIVCLFFWWLIK